MGRETVPSRGTGPQEPKSSKAFERVEAKREKGSQSQRLSVTGSALAEKS